MDYPKDKLHFACLEGNSQDNTWDKLVQFKNTHQNVWLKKNELDNDDRFEKLALLRNQLIEEGLKNEEYVFSVDSDVIDIPPETLKVLINHNVDIVAPYVFIEEQSQFYDTLAYRQEGLNFSHRFPYRPIITGKIVTGKRIGELTKVLRGLKKELKKMDAVTRWSETGRLKILKYLSKFSYITYLSGLHHIMRGIDREQWKINVKEAVSQYLKNLPIFEVDSVGTCYLVKRKVYDEKARYHGGDSEQVVFCNDARAKGFKVWVDPGLTVRHVNLHSYGVEWH